MRCERGEGRWSITDAFLRRRRCQLPHGVVGVPGQNLEAVARAAIGRQLLDGGPRGQLQRSPRLALVVADFEVAEEAAVESDPPPLPAPQKVEAALPEEASARVGEQHLLRLAQRDLLRDVARDGGQIVGTRHARWNWPLGGAAGALHDSRIRADATVGRGPLNPRPLRICDRPSTVVQA